MTNAMPNLRQPKLSFCIHVKNRLSQLSQTLPRNVVWNARAGNIELVLVDFGSTDGTVEWVLNSFPKELQSGYLRFFRADSLPRFHIPTTKNTAHRLARGEVLVNLDADNFTGPGGGEYIYKMFRRAKFNLLLHQFSGHYHDGTYGRIAYTREHFFGVGGYDQAFGPAGNHDTDILARISLLYGLRIIHGTTNFLARQFYRRLLSNRGNPLFNRALKNDKSATVADYQLSSDEWKEMEIQNAKLSARNLESKKLVANSGCVGLQSGIFIYGDGGFRPATKEELNLDLRCSL